MKDLDFSEKITAKLYPIEESDDSALAAERFGGKKRGSLKDSDFLDPKRRSFPVMSCKDVKDAISTWGLYKGPMTFDQFKSKLKAKASKMSCPLPKSWDSESKSGMKDGKSNYDKVNKEELKEDNKKQKKQHYKDAIKDDKKQVKDLKKDEKVDEKKESDAASDKQKAAKEKFLEMIRKNKDGGKKDDKKDDKKGGKKKESEAKTKKQWEKIDKKELDKDSKKEKEEHEKDAVKNDQDKIDKLKKGKPSTKKSVMIHDLKKDQEFDKENKTKDKDSK